MFCLYCFPCFNNLMKNQNEASYIAAQTSLRFYQKDVYCGIFLNIFSNLFQITLKHCSIVCFSTYYTWYWYEIKNFIFSFLCPFCVEIFENHQKSLRAILTSLHTSTCRSDRARFLPFKHLERLNLMKHAHNNRKNTMNFCLNL